MRAGFDRWLLPLGIFTISALAALGIFVFEPSSANRLPAEVVQQAASEPTASSEVASAVGSDAPATDRACQQQEEERNQKTPAGEPVLPREVASAAASGVDRGAKWAVSFRRARG